MTGPGSSADRPLDPGSREMVLERARHAVMAIAKAHTLFSGAANSLAPEHRALADDAFALLEAAVHDLRELVGRLEAEEQTVADRRREGQR